MTTAQFLLLVLLGVALVATAALVRALRKDPARRAPMSCDDPFAPRWADSGVSRWSF